MLKQMRNEKRETKKRLERNRIYRSGDRVREREKWSKTISPTFGQRHQIEPHIYSVWDRLPSIIYHYFTISLFDGIYIDFSVLENAISPPSIHHTNDIFHSLATHFHLQCKIRFSSKWKKRTRKFGFLSFLCFINTILLAIQAFLLQNFFGCCCCCLFFRHFSSFRLFFFPFVNFDHYSQKQIMCRARSKRKEHDRETKRNSYRKVIEPF